MSCLLHDFFWLMLQIVLNCAPDGVYKGLRLTQTLAKESLKFFLSDKNINLIFYLLLVLLPAKQSNILKKGSGIKHPILILSPGSDKMVFTLLEEIIAL